MVRFHDCGLAPCEPVSFFWTLYVQVILLKFSETVSSSGGLPQYVAQTIRNGAPIIQITSPMTPFRATQRGSALGATRYPVAAAPLFGSTSPPLWDKSVSLDSPHSFRGHKFAYRTAWQYQFLTTFPLAATPTNR